MYENYQAENLLNKITAKNIEIGSTVSYKLLSSQRPTNPNRLWHGKVIKFMSSSNTIVVALLDVGYEGLLELVKFEQIVTIDEFTN